MAVIHGTRAYEAWVARQGQTAEVRLPALGMTVRGYVAHVHRGEFDRVSVVLQDAQGKRLGTYWAEQVTTKV